LIELVSSIAFYLHVTKPNSEPNPVSRRENTHFAGSIHMTDIRSNTWSATNIVQAQGADKRVKFEEQRERLANSSSCTENGDLGKMRCRCREETRRRGGQGADSCTGEHEGNFRKDGQVGWVKKKLNNICPRVG
jgi:hypothetical protein